MNDKQLSSQGNRRGECNFARSYYRNNGWNPELGEGVLAVVLPNSTNLAVVIPKCSVLGILYAM